MSRRRRKTYHHGDLRNALLKAAIPVLARKGVAGLSLREVAASAGVSHTAPYRHFRNKAALLEAIAVQGHNSLRDGSLAAQQKWPRDPKRQWIETGLNYLHFILENPEIAQVMFSNVLPRKSADSALHQAMSEAIQGLVQVIENGKTAGLYANRQTEDLVLTSLSTVHGLVALMSQGFIGGAKPSPDQAQAMAIRVAETLWHGMVSPPSG
jgi:AcrR family transcriptional regulator